MADTVKILKIRTPKIFALITLKVEQDCISLRVMRPKDADRMENSVDPEQTAPSSPCTQTCLSKNLGSLRYFAEMNCSY